MGWNSGWIAAKGISTRKMLDELKLKVVYSTWDFYTRDADVLTTKLESGWLLVDYRENWVGAGDEGPLANLSTHAELVVSCVADEHTMTSEAKAFRAGKKLWEILHAPNDDSAHLEFSGTPPECFEAIRKERLDKLSAYRREGEFHVDPVFDVPVDVCDALVGFRFDKTMRLADPCFILWELG